MDLAEKELAKLRQNLLDLTMRNSLLNYRPSKVRAIRIVDEIPREVFDILVLSGRRMRFLPRRATSEDGTDRPHAAEVKSQEDRQRHLRTDEQLLWQFPEPDEEVAKRHKDTRLQTDLEGPSLQRRLFRIWQEAKSFIEERGYNALYLALGFLEWKESPHSLDFRKAPLILVPVELKRDSVDKPFSIEWNGEDISTNISLQAMLREHGVAIPDFEVPDDKSGIDLYFQQISESISIYPDWRIVNEIHLGFFSFTKFVMYRDLDPNAWTGDFSPKTHPLVRLLLDPDGTPRPQGSLFSEDNVDSVLGILDTYHVLDADSSQIAVIENVKAGHNLVVQGPPGTGKSQTIVNIIAELLAQGKTVLFVSEKLAALQVVKRRLDQVGLGEYCLELHSGRTKKTELLKELEGALSASINCPRPKRSKYKELECLRSDLNSYAALLRSINQRSGLTTFDLFCMKESAVQHFRSKTKNFPSVRIDPDQLTRETLTEGREKLRNLSEIYRTVRPVSSNPWRMCRPVIYVPPEVDQILEAIRGLRSRIESLNTILHQLVSLAGVTYPVCLNEVDDVIRAAKVVARSKPTDRQVLLNDDWNTASPKAIEIIETLEELNELELHMRNTFTEEAFDSDVDVILSEYKEYASRFVILRLVLPRLRRIARRARRLFCSKPPRSTAEIISEIELLCRFNALRTKLRECQDSACRLFGSYWQGEDTNPEALRSFADWIVSFRREIVANTLTDHSLEIVASGAKSDEILKLISPTAAACAECREACAGLWNRLNIDAQEFGYSSFESMPVRAMMDLLIAWDQNIGSLMNWTRFCDARNRCLSTAAAPVVELIDSDSLPPDDLIPCFEGNVADALIAEIARQEKHLREFVAELQEVRINRFAHLDREIIRYNRSRVINQLEKRRPRVLGGASPSSEAGILLGEIGRKRRHMPIRKLMTLAGRLIQRLKPCFMMSPLSVALFLEPGVLKFDVVIFDEASQVKPEDSIGALLRASQAVVIGDTKQLPPTTFFDRMLETDHFDEDHAAPIAEMESLLHLCQRSFPSKTLRWHYRSKHESLIAVSNREFYDNRLLIFPSPVRDRNELGLEFVHLPETVYDRGGTSTNRDEARYVAKRVIEHYRHNPGKSLGVGTFNVKQQQAILEEVELLLRLHPEIEGSLYHPSNEPFFVKNLETIQGDERDVIFLSVGYGYDADGKLSLNFGPLNHKGGERRLNVLITRARERCVVFSNFRGEDLQLCPGSPFGVRALKTFLEYAEKKSFRELARVSGDTQSPFEDAVCRLLRDHGYEVHTQVGCAGFRIDIAVVHPSDSSVYAAGIECDGAQYHSSLVARDRDRLRQEILEARGWRIIRVWSTDWYLNREACQKRLLDQVERACRQDPRDGLAKPTEGCLHGESPQITARSNARKRKPHEVQRNYYDVAVPVYEVCTSVPRTRGLGLSDQPIGKLVGAVEAIVNVEAPVHIDTVFQRMRKVYRLGRLGHKARKKVKEAISLALREKRILRRGNFLWTHSTKVRVRRRIDDPPPKLSFVSSEEIAEAMKLVLRYQFSTHREDLVRQTAKVLGIRYLNQADSTRLRRILAGLIRKGELEVTTVGAVTLKANPPEDRRSTA